MIPPIPATLPPLQGHAEGVWLKGDWHMHSRHSTDSSNNPEAKIIGFAERQSELSAARVNELASILAQPLQVRPPQAVAELNGIARGLLGSA